MAILLVFSGLPGTGKSTLSKLLAREIGAQYIRIDSIENALRKSVLKIECSEDAGYKVAIEIAKDNLWDNNIVIADLVNPVDFTRKWWAEASVKTQSKLINIEVTCSDEKQHRYRVENRISDIKGHQLPTWEKVLNREYEPFIEADIHIDTSNKSIEESLDELLVAFYDQ